jgi:hypothetical protein
MGAVFRDDVPIVLEGEDLEIRRGPIGGGMSVAFVKMSAGARLARARAAHLDTSSPGAHWVYVLRGQLRLATRPGVELYEAGQALHLRSTHALEAVEECELVAFSPASEASGGTTGAA